MPHDDEKQLSDLIKLAQSLLSAKFQGQEITPSLIEQEVNLAATLIPATSVQKLGAIGELIRRYSFWIGQDTSMLNKDNHIYWLNAGRKKDWHYWTRYQEWLERKMPIAAVDALDKSTDLVLGYLEDPKRQGSWDRRGLVVGHVQSGKTSHYSGLVCKAADAGYKVIIVLAGLHNNLRSQTQVRLEEAFLGFETPLNEDAKKPIGVGEINSDAELCPHCATHRLEKGDFNTKVSTHMAVSPEEKPWLFVVKKNKTVLERLLKWIRNHVADATDAATNRRFVSHIPLLLIDDEADHASVDTGEQLFNEDGKPDEEHQPTAINSRIRKILHTFSKAAYVGYTATPFANVFIHRRNATPDEGPDLFPEAFIVNLAAPNNYVGPTRLFGTRTIEGRAGELPLIRYVSDHINHDSGGWMPCKHKKDHIPIFCGQNTIPTSLRKAIGAFLLACAVRDLRGFGNSHSSMLIHVTRFTDVQKNVYEQVSDEIKRIRQRLTRKMDHISLLNELRMLWHEDFEPTSESVIAALNDQNENAHMPTWAELENILPAVVSDIQVRMINGTAKDALDYVTSGNKGLKIIAIGGDKLARGLTLEGLCTSYFVRSSKMYDTLMQMGRWFGYRPHYLDLCRLYTTPDLVEWFGHIADASDELREEFDVMASSGATPKDYGLKVQSHPVLMVTSQLKMRSARNLQISFSGELLETVSFYQEPEKIKVNLDATNELIGKMGDASKISLTREVYLWRNIAAEFITDFLGAYKTHHAASKVNSALLAHFIQAMNRNDELTSWTVALIGGLGGKYIFANNLCIERMPKRKRAELEDRYSIGRLLSPGDESIDLSETEWAEALALTLQWWQADPEKQKNVERPTIPSGSAIRQIRGKYSHGQQGLLLLYPLDPDEAKLPDTTYPVIGFGISFPNSSSCTTVSYEVDHLLWESEYGPAD